MTDLFTLTGLASYLQMDLDTATATLARQLATSAIRAVAPDRFDDLADVSLLKSVALSVAARTVVNPVGLRTRQYDEGVSESYAAEFVGPYLTDRERLDVRACLGLAAAGSDGAYIVSLS